MNESKNVILAGYCFW